MSRKVANVRFGRRLGGFQRGVALALGLRVPNRIPSVSEGPGGRPGRRARGPLTLPVLLGALSILVGVSGCEREKPPAAGAKTPGKLTTTRAVEELPPSIEAVPGEKELMIGFSQCTVKEPWRVEFNKRLKRHAREKYPNVKLDILDADDRIESQVAQMRSFIRRDVDAILISPKDAPGLTGVVKEATEAGIPVVVLDRDVNFKGYACFVGGDNTLIGRAAGQVAVEMLGGAGKAKGVVYEICGGLASTPGQERRDGFHGVVEKEPGVTIIGGLDCDWKKDKAQTTFQDALKANPVVDLVYAHNDPMAHGAYQAAKAAGRHEEMKFIGIDALPEEGIRWVKSGELTATLLYPTPGEVGLDMAMKILRAEPVKTRVTLPTRVFTKENADQGGQEVAVPAP